MFIKNLLKKEKKLILFLKSHNKEIVLIFLFVSFAILRLYQLEERLGFSHDQLDNAWAVKKILLDHEYPLLGMVAKGNSGFHIGPFYYYLISPFYAFFGLDPISAGYIAFFTSAITFFAIFFVLKKILSYQIALIAVFIFTFSAFIIDADKTQWPVNFLVPISLGVFYSLYKIIQGHPKYLIFLAVLLGFSVSIHFTSIFFFIFTILAFPFFPKTKKTFYMILLSFPLFFIWLIPLIRAEIISNNSESSNLTTYIDTYYHGIHLRRFIQITHDAFIEFYLITKIKIIDIAGFLLLPLFWLLLFKKRAKKESLIIIYLCFIWILVPWIVFSTYKGEISNYYFYTTRPIALIVFSFLIYTVYSMKMLTVRVLVIAGLVIFGYSNTRSFIDSSKYGHLPGAKAKLIQDLNANKIIENDPWNLEYYLYSLYKNGKLDLKK